MSQAGFSTPAAPAESEIVIKKSRFIGRIIPVHTIDEAEAQIVTIRANHKSANHNCFAYSVGIDVPVERFSDDGEPSGTAGRPILEVIRKQQLSNVLVVVTRYFGGTLLGAGGLVRAYTDSTVSALDKANLLLCQQMTRLDVTTDYGLFGKVEYELTQNNHYITNRDFGANVTLTLFVPIDQQGSLVQNIADWTSGQAEVSTSHPQWVGVGRDNQLVFDVWDA